jgi:uncharacterized membrane protein YuzA (DUF378 family)
MQWLFDSAGGRKMLLGIMGIVSMTILAALEIIDGNVAVETIKWIIIGVAGALAVSDVGNSIASRNQTTSVTTSETVIAKPDGDPHA